MIVYYVKINHTVLHSLASAISKMAQLYSCASKKSRDKSNNFMTSLF